MSSRIAAARRRTRVCTLIVTVAAACTDTTATFADDDDLATRGPTVSVNGGSAAYLRFAVSAGQTATVQLSTLPSNVQLTLVRTR